MHYGARVAGLMFIAAITPLRAQVVWIGGTGTPVGNFLDPANWSERLVPNASQDAIFPGGLEAPGFYAVYVQPSSAVRDLDFTNTSESGLYSFSGNNENSTFTLNGDLSTGSWSGAEFLGSLNFILPTGTHNFVIGNSSSINIASPITGPGEIKLSGSNTSSLYLSGNNTGWTGGLMIVGDNHVGVYGVSNRALGTGPVIFDSASRGNITLQTSTTINSLSGGYYDSEAESGSEIALDENVTLTVNQTANTTYAGIISGFYNGESGYDGGLTKTGSGTLTLTGTVDLYGPISVGGGSLVLNGLSDGYFYGNSLEVSNGASATIANRAYVSTADGYVATGGSGGTLTVTAGSQWGVGNLVVGNPAGGNGIMIISDGATVSADNVIISKAGPSTSSLTVTGVLSHLDAEGPLRVGYNNGNARLSIINGGTATSVSAIIGDNAYGRATVDGAGSAWTIFDPLLKIGNGTSANAGLTLKGNGILNVGGFDGTGTIMLGAGGGGVGAGALYIGEHEYSPFGGIVNATTITTDTGTGLIRFDTGTTSAAPYYLTKDGTANGIAVLITGATSVNNQQGYNVLKGTNSYTGGTTITGGTLVYGAANAFGTGSITLNGGALKLANGFSNIPNALTLTNGTLAGNWTFTTPQSFGAGVTLSPGNSPGTITFGAGLTLTGTGGASTIEISGATNVPGTSADLIAVTGTLNLTGLTGYTLNVISLLPDTVTPGAVSGLSSPVSWTIFTSTTLTGFDAADFTINQAGFVNTGIFALNSSGNNIQLTFTPVPEPSTYALMLAGLAFAGLRTWRKRASSRRSLGEDGRA